MEENIKKISRNQRKSDLKKESNSDLYLARHLTIDFYDCDTDVLLDCKTLEESLIISAKAIWATIVNSNFHMFEPQGVSWVVVLSESHFTIHTWPEHGYAAVDMFTCWDMKFEKWIDFLTKIFKSRRVELVTDLQRWLATQFENKKISNSIIIKEEKNNWEKEFTKNNAWWIACSVDVYNCNPNTIRDSESIKRYVKELCELIEMKRFWDTEVVHFWEDEKVAGYSMTQLIETSLISGHFANKTNASYIDIFSCKYYNPSVVANFTTHFFGWKNFKLNINMRDE